MGWLHCSSGNAFYFGPGGIVAMVRKRGDDYECFDLTSEDWTPVNRVPPEYCPLFLSAWPTLREAQATIEARFGKVPA